MKKIFVVLVLVVMTSSFCFAQQPVTTAKQAVPVQVVTKTLVGKVDTVTLADPTKGTKQELAVVKDDGSKTTFAIASVALIYDAEMKVTTLDKLNKGDKVEVKYSTDKNRVNKATLISVLK